MHGVPAVAGEVFAGLGIGAWLFGTPKPWILRLVAVGLLAAAEARCSSSLPAGGMPEPWGTLANTAPSSASIMVRLICAPPGENFSQSFTREHEAPGKPGEALRRARIESVSELWVTTIGDTVSEAPHRTGALCPRAGGVEPTLLGVEPTLVGVEPALIGVEPALIGVQPTPLGVEATPFGVEPALLGVEPALVGVEVTPVGVGGRTGGVKPRPG